ncbi:MAG TPA: hypothetical protein VMZ92_00145, partial [Planctomycetota bacterium]|nr:hypothetical protein [Planctomycetota bacterium]
MTGFSHWIVTLPSGEIHTRLTIQFLLSSFIGLLVKLLALGVLVGSVHHLSQVFLQSAGKFYAQPGTGRGRPVRFLESLDFHFDPFVRVHSYDDPGAHVGPS